MQQVTLDLDLDLDSNEDDRPGPVLDREREQQLIALMAQAIVEVLQSTQGENHEPA